MSAAQSTERAAARESLKAVQNFCHPPNAPENAQQRLMAAIFPYTKQLATHILSSLAHGVPSTVKGGYVDGTPLPVASCQLVVESRKMD